MKRTFRLVIGLAAAMAALLSGCGSTQTDKPSSSQVASPASQTNPGERIYKSAEELGVDLSRHGVNCDVTTTQTSPSDAGSCTLPGNGGDGIKVSITVWPTTANATAGIAAVRNHQSVVNRISGDRTYLLIGANWLVDFNQFGVAAAQVKNVFGGTVVTVS
ncbi:hypothetical protein EF294_07515 [Gordonia oryzae]|uniref:DUF3558 domain-containing protein n=1 Tax=Gordonia oryzae TaxID=2487349 RepID=A0A3N4GPT8_9ACTN|nr:hypothetical protein [Gordonia oryzae]RPA64923.1 hypothetical protein EF294_07515 [Gordonia oryzae]